MSAAEQPSRRERVRPARAITRVLVVWLLTAGTLLALSDILNDVHVKDVGAAFVAAALIGLINAVVWPLVLWFALPFTVLTLGLGVVVLNGAIVLLVSEIAPGLEVATLAAGVIVAVGITVVNTVASYVFAVEDEGFWYRRVVRRYERRTVPTAVRMDLPGVLFLEIDGLAHDVLVRAIRDGTAPTMARWLRGGTHHLTRWETDWSSQTGACQAGLLHGDNHDMPAFRWWEKDRGTAIVTNHPRDAMELERRHSNGRGLLFSDGASRANIVSGDAPHSQLTMSTVLRRDREGRIGQDYFAYFANPYNIVRTLVLVVADVASERWSAFRQRRLDVQPRIHRSFAYALVRAWATVVQRDLQVNSVIGDMYAGRPVVYTTFLAYDEVAHHSGIERPEALATLRHVDRQIARIATVARSAPRSYELVVLSDHGQSQGATFLDRYGVSLETLVDELLTPSPDRPGQGEHTKHQTSAIDGNPSEAQAFLGASISEAASGSTRTSRTLSRVVSGRAQDGEVHLGDADRDLGDEHADGLPEVVVMASGCLGLISFPREPGRVTLERLERLHPRLLPALREHPGIGFLLVRSERHGAIAMGAAGASYLEEGRVEGEDPLAPFGPRAAAHVSRTDAFPHCPDIVVNSTYWRDADEVAAFEELVGSHGGMGGTQSYPFLLHPTELELPDEEMVGAELVHRHLRRWLVELGHSEYGES
jgi:uncharacterized membrane protein YvlD (DUF360 family)